MIFDSTIPGGGTPAQWTETLGLDDVELARRALRGDQVARHVARMSLEARLLELGADLDDVIVLPAWAAAAARKWRRRAWRRRGGR